MFDLSIRETLAKIQHSIWSHWMRYMFTQGTHNEDGTWTMPEEKVKRWTRQLNTDYDDLTEKEKDSDRHQAHKILNALTHVEVEKLTPNSALIESLTRHHHHYVKRFLGDLISSPDRLQLRLALHREALGLVPPYIAPNPSEE